MAEHAVVNASPLIFLSRAGLLDLLQLLSSEIVVPEIVATEIEIRGKSDPTAQAIASTAWLLVTQTPPVPTQIQSWGLGPGESSVLAWAQAHPGSEAIIDDLAGRRCAAVEEVFHPVPERSVRRRRLKDGAPAVELFIGPVIPALQFFR